MVGVKLMLYLLSIDHVVEWIGVVNSDIKLCS